MTVQLSLAGETPLLVPLPNPAPFPSGANTQGTSMANRTMYMPNTLLSQMLGVQKGKKTIYLRRLQLPQAVQVGGRCQQAMLAGLEGVAVFGTCHKHWCGWMVFVQGSPTALSGPRVVHQRRLAKAASASPHRLHHRLVRHK